MHPPFLRQCTRMHALRPRLWDDRRQVARLDAHAALDALELVDHVRLFAVADDGVSGHAFLHGPTAAPTCRPACSSYTLSTAGQICGGRALVSTRKSTAPTWTRAGCGWPARTATPRAVFRRDAVDLVQIALRPRPSAIRVASPAAAAADRHRRALPARYGGGGRSGSSGRTRPCRCLRRPRS